MAEKKQAEVKEVAPPDPVQKALAALASPEATAAIATLKELKPLVQAKSTSELKSTINGSGFKSLVFNSHIQRIGGPGVPKALARKFVTQKLQSDIMSRVPAKLKNLWTELLNMSVEILEAGAPTDCQSFALTFQSGSGGVGMMAFSAQAMPDDKFRLAFAAAEGMFQLAPDLLVINRTKENFFSSKSWVEFRAVDRGIKESDIQGLLNLVFPQLAVFLGELAYGDGAVKAVKGPDA